jgi:outer membrane protein
MNKWIAISALVIALAGFIHSWVNADKSVAIQKTGYIETTVVFDEFEMKKELQVKLQQDLQTKQYFIDSLMFVLQTMNNQLSSTPNPSSADIQKFQQVQNVYMQQKELFDSYSYEKTAQFDAQIIDQMSQYVRDYGKKNGYDYIFGADGSGAIMYAPDAANITKDVIIYINATYQGKL